MTDPSDPAFPVIENYRNNGLLEEVYSTGGMTLREKLVFDLYVKFVEGNVDEVTFRNAAREAIAAADILFEELNKEAQ